ncbi:sugar ABC transporter ATP-binding protein [Sphaerochaeta halotolerans]|uniref:sugar ABC transporter ATP-binding protein n=1 Tax=Sphaerochaeta halotolerans TaxID=2293840 RepID=UPI00140412CB|nr:sugar ABC transporter ATP-binding protein [Sphaerochaeta halotolerans]
MEKDLILKMNSVTKRYPGVTALDNVSFEVERGKVHALVGENGAGKSTLMNILSGATSMDDGEIFINGKKEIFTSPEDSIKHGIAMIYQELNLVDELTVAENIFLGVGQGRSILFHKKQMIEKAEVLLKKYGIDIKADALIKDLSIAKQQMVEIAKALSRKATILIMDEPTSSLSLSDTEHLFSLIKNFQKQGMTIVYISHRMEEIFSICNSVTVLCDGKLINNWNLKDVDENMLISAMVGREITQLFPKEHFALGEPVLQVESFTKDKVFKDISFDVRKGEIFGMAGLIGSGRTEICLSIFGAMKHDSGTITVHGNKIINKHPSDAMKNRIAYVPEDRKLLGLNMKSSIKNNMSITNEDKISKYGYVLKDKERTFVDSMIEQLKVKCFSKMQNIGGLSGGNQQKVVLAKWIARDIDVLILDEPTRGVDVGAKEELHRIIVELAKSGLAIILISSELPEVLGMSDRILVVYEGTVAGIVDASNSTQETIMKLASGRHDV